MIGVIIATHGTMAGAALDLCKMLTGEKEKVETIGFYPGEGLEELMEEAVTVGKSSVGIVEVE